MMGALSFLLLKEPGQRRPMPTLYERLAKRISPTKRLPEQDILNAGPLDYVKKARPRLRVSALATKDTREGAFGGVKLRLSKICANGKEAGLLLHSPTLETFAGIVFGEYRFAESVVQWDELKRRRVGGFKGLIVLKEGVPSFEGLEDEQAFRLLPTKKRREMGAMLGLLVAEKA